MTRYIGSEPIGSPQYSLPSIPLSLPFYFPVKSPPGQSPRPAAVVLHGTSDRDVSMGKTAGHKSLGGMSENVSNNSD
ncbi:unnamed protein product [Protopolystoma xenopodis]|uniref:Uncharacterized protein n=1 Tax=Protopolystoma xenopodis TaxID=117903 RepID=A0A3S5AZP2_9PLAT|nr:unnamed protein product [Protopolystoma xenopodis]